MQTKRIFDKDAALAFSERLPGGNYASLLVIGTDVVIPQNAVLGCGIKLNSAKYSALVDVLLNDMPDIDDYIYGRRYFVMVQTGVDTYQFVLRVPFSLPGEVVNALGIGSEDVYTLSYTVGNVASGTISVCLEPTMAPPKYIPWLMPGSLNAAIGTQPYVFTYPNLARVFGKSAANADPTYVCKNGVLVVDNMSGTELLLTGALDGRIEEDDTSLVWWMVNTNPSGFLGEVDGELKNTVKVSQMKSTAVTTSLYGLGFFDPRNTIGNCCDPCSPNSPGKPSNGLPVMPY